MADNKDKKVLNVPHLRFPEFSGEWEEVTLKGIADFQKDRISSELLDKYTYISTENIQQNFGGVQSANSIPFNTKVIAYKKNDILLSNIRPYLKKVWLADRDGGCSADVFVLRSKCCEQSFLYNVIASERFIDYVMSGAKGVKMPRGDKKQMESFKFSLPTVTEQRKISGLLSLLDERIATQNKVIEKLETLIKGIADSIFKTAKAHKTISELSSTVTTGKDKAGIGNVPLYGSTGIIGKTERASNSGNIVLVARVGSIGTIQFVDEPCGVSDNTLIIDAGINTKFIYFFLCTYDFSSITSGTTQPLITATSLKKVKIPIFCPELQNHIVCMLSSFSDIISTERAMLEQYVTQKQYLLRQMFI